MTYGEAGPDSDVGSASDLDDGDAGNDRDDGPADEYIGEDSRGTSNAASLDAGPAIPSVLLRAMKDRMRSRRLSEPDDPDYVHCRLTTDDEASTVYVINDGNDRCLIGRLVGKDSDGCIYCLVGFTSRFDYEQLETGDVELEEAFSASRDIALCGVFEDEQGGANLFVVQNFRSADRIPDEYLPPTPFLELTDEDSETASETGTAAEADDSDEPVSD